MSYSIPWYIYIIINHLFLFKDDSRPGEERIQIFESPAGALPWSPAPLHRFWLAEAAQGSLPALLLAGLGYTTPRHRPSPDTSRVWARRNCGV